MSRLDTDWHTYLENFWPEYEPGRVGNLIYIHRPYRSMNEHEAFRARCDEECSTCNEPILVGSRITTAPSGPYFHQHIKCYHGSG